MTNGSFPSHPAPPHIAQGWVTRERSRLRSHLVDLRRRRARLLACGEETRVDRVRLGIARQITALDRQARAIEAQLALLERLSGLLTRAEEAQGQPAAREQLASVMPGKRDLWFSLSSLDHALSRHRALAQSADRLAALLGEIGDTTRPPAGPGADIERAVVARVLDGDTVVLEDGRRVRYLGMDTPGLRGHFGQREPFAEEAAEANRERVEGRRVWLERDASDEDELGHLLRHVLVDGRCVGVELVRVGLARALPLYPDLSRADEILGAEREARQAQRGMWSV